MMSLSCERRPREDLSINERDRKHEDNIVIQDILELCSFYHSEFPEHNCSLQRENLRSSNR